MKDIKELGLVAAQQLFQVEDLHYGFWKKNQKVIFSDLVQAQQQYTEFLFQYIQSSIKDKTKDRILDVGCGIGVMTYKLLEQDYHVDGIVPSEWMANRAKQRISTSKNSKNGTIFHCSLENFIEPQKQYQTIFFSESFQYINLEEGFKKLRQILAEHGKIIIFDFFHKDRIAGRSPLGGGHSLQNFTKMCEKYQFELEQDLDVTENLAPNLDLLCDLIVHRFLPFSSSLGQFLSYRYPFIYKTIHFLFRKKLEKLKFKYSEKQNGENFKKYKSYRLMILNKSH